MTAFFVLLQVSDTYAACHQLILSCLSSLQSFTGDLLVYHITYLLQYMILLIYDLHPSHLTVYDVLILVGTADASLIHIISKFH